MTTNSSRTRRTSRFVHTGSIVGYCLVDGLGQYARSPFVDRNGSSRSTRPSVPTNLRTANEIAAWAQSVVLREQEEAARNANTDNWVIRVASGDDFKVSAFKNLTTKLSELGFKVFFKVAPGFNVNYIESFLVVPAKKDCNWRLLPATTQNLLQESRIEFWDKKLSNGVECLRVTFFGD